MRLVGLIIIGFQIFNCSAKVQHTVGDWMTALKINPDIFWSADVGVATNEIDSLSTFFRVIDKSQELILCEGKIIQINKSESLFLIQGIESDEQCSHFHHYCFEGNPLLNQINKKKFDDYFLISLDSVMINLVSDQVYKCINKYMQKIRSNYLGDDAQMIQVLREFYDLHITFDLKNTKLTLGLFYCDYIPLNAVDIELEDQETIQNGTLKKQFVLNGKKKKFKVK